MKELKKINLNAYGVKEIALFSGKSQKEIISFDVGRYNNIKFKTLNLYGEEYETTGARLEYISLKNEIVNARKVNLKRKDNFIVKIEEYNYLTNNKKLYINIDEEEIIIKELEETSEEFYKGENRINKNYQFDNLNIGIYDLKIFTINEDELKKMTYRERERYRIEDINEKIEEYQKIIDERGILKINKAVENLKTLLKNGSVAMGYKYELEEKNTFKISIYNRTEKSAERLQYLKNYEYLKKNYAIDTYSENYGASVLFQKLGIDLYKVDIETILKGSKKCLK